MLGSRWHKADFSSSFRTFETQWNLKPAQRLAEGQKFKVRRAPRRDVNAISDTGYEIPEGFRGG